MPLRRKKLLHEPLEERQLLAADSGLGGMSDLDNVSLVAIFPQPRSFYESHQAASFDMINASLASTTASLVSNVTISQPLGESETLTAWRPEPQPREFNPTLPLAQFRFYSREEVFSTPTLATKFGLDPYSPEESFAKQFYPAPREHGKIVPLVFGKTPFSSDFEEDELMYTRSGSSGGPGEDPSGGGWVSGGDFSINSFYWSTFSGGAISTASGGGIFPDQSFPGQTGNYNQFRIYVTANNTTSSEKTFTIAARDIVNWELPGAGTIIVDPNDYDNYGSQLEYRNVNDTVINTITFNPGESATKHITVTVTDAHAGDNWIFRGHYSNLASTTSGGGNTGVPLGYSHVDTEPLTVWRRLWVECDAMQYNDASTGEPSTSPSPSSYLSGFVASELAHTCIVTTPYLPNIFPMVVGFTNPMTKVEYETLTGYGGSGVGLGRDSQVTSDAFWTVRIVMASKLDVNLIWPNAFPKDSFKLGLYQTNKSTIVLFYESINSMISVADRDNAIQTILLHEIGHVLTLSDAESAAEGVMSASETNLLLPDYQKFLLADILRIQEKSQVATSKRDYQ